MFTNLRNSIIQLSLECIIAGTRWWFFQASLQIIRISVEKTSLALLDPEVAFWQTRLAWLAGIFWLTWATAEIQFQCKGLGFVRLVCSIVCALVLCRPTWQQLSVHSVSFCSSFPKKLAMWNFWSNLLGKKNSMWIFAVIYTKNFGSKLLR